MKKLRRNKKKVLDFKNATYNRPTKKAIKDVEKVEAKEKERLEKAEKKRLEKEAKEKERLEKESK